MMACGIGRLRQVVAERLQIAGRRLVGSGGISAERRIQRRDRRNRNRNADAGFLSCR